MGIGTFFSRLVGGNASQSKASPPPRPATAAPPPPVGNASGSSGRDQAILHREEVLDGRNRLYGYRFRLCADDDASLGETAFLAALGAAGVQSFAQRRLAVIPISLEMIDAGQHRALCAPHTVFQLDLRQAGANTDALLSQLQAIREDGGKVGLIGLSSESINRSLLDLAHIAFLDLQEFSLSALPRFAADLRKVAPKLQLAATSVHSWAERRMCAGWEFDYCLGCFATMPDEEEKDSRLDQSRTTVLDLLNHLQNDDVTDAELGDIAKRDPNIAFHLLRLANSPAVGLVSPIGSLEQAFMVLGRHQVYRWLMVSMFRVGKVRDRDEALLELALSRARFLETVAAPVLPKKGRDELFLVGLLSLMDLLLAMPMEQMLARINVAPPVREVLVSSGGPYARFLMLAMAMEKGHTARAAELAASLGLSVHTLEMASLTALRWAEAAMRGEQLAS
jgi:EAL and modified HD-GYP domain-containing signal transduction protein